MFGVLVATFCRNVSNSVKGGPCKLFRESHATCGAVAGTPRPKQKLREQGLAACRCGDRRLLDGTRKLLCFTDKSLRSTGSQRYIPLFFQTDMRM